MASADPDINRVGRTIFLWTAASALLFALAAYMLVSL